MRPIEFYRGKLSDADQAFVEMIEKEAEQTPARDKGLAIHLRAIETLRAKGYSYRDIAGWFGERGLKVSHVDVWRAHKNGLESNELFDAAEHDEEWGEFVKKKQSGNVTEFEEREVEAGRAESADPNAAGTVGKAEVRAVEKSSQRRARNAKGGKRAV